MGDLIKVLDEFGFVEPVRGIKKEPVIISDSSPKITLNKNFYPDETKEAEQIDILKAEFDRRK